MITRFAYLALLIVLVPTIFTVDARAQVLSAPYLRPQNKIVVSFTDDLRAINLPGTLIFYEDETGNLVQLRATASQVTPNSVEIGEFRTGTEATAPSVNLISGGGTVPPIPSGSSRTYTVILKKVLLNGETQDRPVQIAVELKPNFTPQVFVAAIDNKLIPYNRREITVQPVGISAREFLDRFKSNPAQIKIIYTFNKDDPAPKVETRASSIRGNPDDASPVNLIIVPEDALPLRAKKYSVKITFPASALQGVSVSPGFELPSATKDIDATRAAELTPPGQSERSKTEFFLETTFTTTVNPQNRKRTKVGILGIHWKPLLPLLTYNVFGEEGNKPFWMAFRPLLEADFDTQSPKNSKSPNRIQLGFDYELGRDAGLQKKGLQFVQQLVWINGLRYDSDRDFKLQTLYWHTEFIPRFLNFEQTTEARQFAFDVANDSNTLSRGPFVSAYRVRPSIGYDLGGTIRRDQRAINAPTENISRLVAGLDLGLELRRVASFNLNNTYYFLENVSRRRNRDYLEARFELNTGFLFNRNFNGLQNAITLKFQRGDQPPTFGSVNAFSVGFKIFR
jgi:hypothetical protein